MSLLQPYRCFSFLLQDEIFGSAYASAIYLSDILHFPSDKRVYVIGEEGIEHELQSVGIDYTGGTVCPRPTAAPFPFIAAKAYTWNFG